MKFNFHFTESLQSLFLSYITSKQQDEVDCFGVGAMMPQDMPEAILLNNTELYGV